MKVIDYSRPSPELQRALQSLHEWYGARWSAYGALVSLLSRVHQICVAIECMAVDTERRGKNTTGPWKTTRAVVLTDGECGITQTAVKAMARVAGMKKKHRESRVTTAGGGVSPWECRRCHLPVALAGHRPGDGTCCGCHAKPKKKPKKRRTKR